MTRKQENRAAHKALVRHGLRLMQTSEISWADAARARVATACSSKETPSTDLLKTLYGDTALYGELPKAAKDFDVDEKGKPGVSSLRRARRHQPPA